MEKASKQISTPYAIALRKRARHPRAQRPQSSFTAPWLSGGAHGAEGAGARAGDSPAIDTSVTGAIGNSPACAGTFTRCADDVRDVLPKTAPGLVGGIVVNATWDALTPSHVRPRCTQPGDSACGCWQLAMDIVVPQADGADSQPHGATQRTQALKTPGLRPPMHISATASRLGPCSEAGHVKRSTGLPSCSSSTA